MENKELSIIDHSIFNPKSLEEEVLKWMEENHQKKLDKTYKDNTNSKLKTIIYIILSIFPSAITSIMFFLGLYLFTLCSGDGKK